MRKGPSCSSWQTLSTQWEFSLELQINPQALNSQLRIHAHAGAEETWQGKVSCVLHGSGRRIQPGFRGVTWRAEHCNTSQCHCCGFTANTGAVSSSRWPLLASSESPRCKAGGCREAQRVTPGPRSIAANRSWCSEDRCPPAVLGGPGTAAPWCACRDAYSFLVARLPRGTGGVFVPTTRTFCETFAALGCSTERLRSSPFRG